LEIAPGCETGRRSCIANVESLDPIGGKRLAGHAPGTFGSQSAPTTFPFEACSELLTQTACQLPGQPTIARLGQDPQGSTKKGSISFLKKEKAFTLSAKPAVQMGQSGGALNT
jgi:hypothetical protein